MNANLALLVDKEYDGHAQPNSEMAEQTKGTETCMSCFIRCWTALLCTQFLFQPFTGKLLELVEDASLCCFQFHHLFSCIIRTGKVELHLSPVGSSFGIFGSNNHFCLFLSV